MKTTFSSGGKIVNLKYEKKKRNAFLTTTRDNDEERTNGLTTIKNNLSNWLANHIGVLDKIATTYAILFFFNLNFADGQHFHTETCVVSLLPRSSSNSFVSVNEPSWPEMMRSFLLPKISSRDRTYPSFFKHLPTVEFIWCTIVQLKKKMQRKKYCIFIWLNFDKMSLWLQKHMW